MVLVLVLVVVVALLLCRKEVVNAGYIRLRRLRRRQGRLRLCKTGVGAGLPERRFKARASGVELLAVWRRGKEAVETLKRRRGKREG